MNKIGLLIYVDWVNFVKFNVGYKVIKYSHLLVLINRLPPAVPIWEHFLKKNFVPVSHAVKKIHFGLLL